MAATVALLVSWGTQGAKSIQLYTAAEAVDHLMSIGDIFLMCLIVYMCVKYRKVIPAVLSVAQTGLLLYVEANTSLPEVEHMMIDWLTVLMCIIIAFVGGFICIYTVGYMKGYHAHHKEYQDRQPFFFSMLFLFLAAMFGLVFSQSLIWMYFFWEITSVISFLMIGYTRTEEAIENSFFRAVDEPVGRVGLFRGHRAAGLYQRKRTALGCGCDGSGFAIGLSRAGGADQIRPAAVFYMALRSDGRAYAFQRAVT